MKILALDTGTSSQSVALLNEDRLIGEYTFHCETSHARHLLRTIQLLLNDFRLTIEDIDGLAVSIGPGSFTGLRIGISTVKGLALASKKPVVGIHTLDALAFNLTFARSLICPIIDAKKGEVYTAIYKMDEHGGFIKLTEDMAIDIKLLLERIHESTIFTGQGVKMYRTLITETMEELATFATGQISTVRASSVAYLGLIRLRQGLTEDIVSLAPVYVRPSEAEIKWRERELLTKVT